MKRILLFVTLCIVVISISCSKQTEYSKLDKYFDTLDENNKFMGSVSVFRGDTQIYSKVIGFCDVDAKVKATTESRYKIGSISKSFTAVLVMQAIEKGLLSSETTLDNYFPSIKNSDKITIDNMLRHRSGIANYFDLVSQKSFIESRTRSAMIDTISIRSHQGAPFAPDSITGYSNSNYLLLSYILEDVYDKTFSEILKIKIINPLGLKNTSLPNRQEGCHSYCYSGNKWDIESDTHPSTIMGAGGIVSTPSDLNHFYYSLFNGKLVSEKSLNEMKTIQDASPLPLGVGLIKIPFYKRIGYGHTGQINGFTSASVYYPEDRISVSITSNGMNYNYNNILIAVLSDIYNEHFDIPTFTTISLSEEDLDKYLGLYSSTQSPIKIDVTKNGDILRVQGTDQPIYELTAIAKDTFEFFFSGSKLEFIFNPKKRTMTHKVMGMVFDYSNEDCEKPIHTTPLETISLSEKDLNKYLGIYSTSKLPIKIAVTKKGNVLVGQGTGQTPFNLTATSKHTFAFTAAGIVMIFNPEKETMTLKQGGGLFEMKRE